MWQRHSMAPAVFSLALTQSRLFPRVETLRWKLRKLDPPLKGDIREEKRTRARTNAARLVEISPNRIASGERRRDLVFLSSSKRSFACTGKNVTLRRLTDPSHRARPVRRFPFILISLSLPPLNHVGRLSTGRLGKGSAARELGEPRRFGRFSEFVSSCGR